MKYRKRRLMTVLFLLVSFLVGIGYEATKSGGELVVVDTPSVLGTDNAPSVGANVTSQLALEALEQIEVKGRAPKTGYKRSQFGDGWASAGRCDVRNFILNRDLTEVEVRSERDCTVVRGLLQDPYTGKQVQFIRGQDTSDDVQIDHVVALSDAWQKGAQQLSFDERQRLANDALNLLAVEGRANSNKSDGDAATWLPPNKSYRCKYVARQIAVKQKYRLWVTSAEKNTMKDVLQSCIDQQLPYVSTENSLIF